MEVRFGSQTRDPTALTLTGELKTALMSFDRLRRLPYREVPPGEYNVILESGAVTPLIEMISMMIIYGATAELGGMFPVEDIGKRLVAKTITLRDEPYNPRFTYMNPCDMFGIPKARVTTFFENGIWCGPWYDQFSASRFGKEPTGHGHEISWGPHNIRLTGGTGPSNEQAALQEMGDGLLITATDYNRSNTTAECSLTSFTRFGTYVVEGGKIVARAPSLRIVDNPADMLRNIKWMSRKENLVPTTEEWGLGPKHSFLVPAYTRLDGLHIIGQTPSEFQR